jgi:spore coat polysaccharide biosynthesis protein SpsF
MSAKTIAVIQARMGSTRFPGKTLERIGDWSLVELVLKRVKQSSEVEAVILATSTNPQDDVLADHVSSLGFPVFRGSEKDVLSRFYQAAESYQPRTVVRITGDCPLISPTLIDYAVETFREKQVDYLTLVIGRDQKNAYPRGFDVEVAKFDSLSNAFNNASQSFEREHVMPYLYTHPDLFSTYRLEPTPEYSRPNYRLCVDSRVDFELIQKIHEHFGERLIGVDPLEIIKFLDENPAIATINLSEKQKHFTVSDTSLG